MQEQQRMTTGLRRGIIPLVISIALLAGLSSSTSAFPIAVDPGNAQVGYRIPGTPIYNVTGFQSGDLASGSYSICIGATCLPFAVRADGTVTGPLNSSVSFSAQTILFATTPVQVTPADPTIGYRIPSTPIYNVQGPHSAILVPGVTFSLCTDATCTPFTLAETCNLQVAVEGHVFNIVCGDKCAAVISGPPNALEGETVTLDGSGSQDPEGDPLRYCWTQLAGTAVPLPACPAPPQLTFTAPEVKRSGETLSFRLIVNAGHQDCDPASADVIITDVNHAPDAVAAAPLEVREGSQIVLDGSGSYDPDRDPIAFQ
jgi:hypothetical protein